MLRRKQLMVGSVLFHVGVLVIFFGHLVGLLTPIALFDALGISHGAKQLLAIAAGGIAGVMAIVGASLLIHRRFFDARVRAESAFSDNMRSRRFGNASSNCMNGAKLNESPTTATRKVFAGFF